MKLALCIVAYGDYQQGQKYTVLESEIAENADNWQVVPTKIPGAGLEVEK